MLNKHSRGCNDITNMKNEICNIEANDFRKLMQEEEGSSCIFRIFAPCFNTQENFK